MWIWIALWWILQLNGNPVAQVTASHRFWVYPQPEAVSPTTRVFDGEIVPVYRIQGDWGKTEAGWFSLANVTLEPALVHFSATYEGTLTLEDGSQIPAGEEVGVAALFWDQALVYSLSGAGWAALNDLTLAEPSVDLQALVEQSAYVKVEQALLYAEPEGEGALERPLGHAMTVLYEQGDWLLLRDDSTFGWGRAEDFDLLPRGQMQGVANAGPVNVRQQPVDGVVVSVLDYQEPVSVLGRQTNWLLIRLENNTEGWVAADYITLAGEFSDLPILE
jgi:hypothetical protein